MANTLEDLLGFVVAPPPGDPSLTAGGDQINQPALIAPPPSGVSSIDGGALQTLIDRASQTGRKIVLSGGYNSTGTITPYVYSQLTINLDNLPGRVVGLTIEGQGSYGTILQSDGTQSPGINITATAGSVPRRVVLRGLQISYTPTTAGTIALQLWNVLRWGLYDLAVFSDRCPISIQGSGNGVAVNCEAFLQGSATTPYTAVWVGAGNSAPGANDGALTSSGPVTWIGGQIASGVGTPAAIIEGGNALPSAFNITFIGTQYQANGGAQTCSWKVDGADTAATFLACHGESNYNNTNTASDWLIGSISKPMRVNIMDGTAWGLGNTTNYQQYGIDVVACKSLTVRGQTFSKLTGVHGYDSGVVHFHAGYPAAGDSVDISAINPGTTTGPMYADDNNIIPASYTGPYQPPNYLLASTGPNGVALVNGAPTLLSWTAPNDGQLHRVTVSGQVNVTGAETGGAINLILAGTSHILIAGNAGVGDQFGVGTANPSLTVRPGETVSVTQTALTAGAAKFFGEIWGS